jgi:formate hydrogenlyase subunit 6/NADH:ubiquinone oxidoreductase subunit I
MSFSVRDGKFDVVVVAGPGLEVWPSVGARAISLICAEAGLTVGLFGGENIQVRGVVPLPGTGALVLAQDVQGRIHRIRARAVVKMSAPLAFPQPFPGWRSQGLIPMSTALRLSRESKVRWDPLTVILGTGNRALRFGSGLLESGVPEVYCVETYTEWGAKRFAGWEVERRRFEMNGGKIIEAKPLSLTPKGPLRWELRLQDKVGVRVLDVARVISAGPFRDVPEIKEYPPGSLLFELSQTSSANRAEDVEGWSLEEERGKWLAGKIVKALVTDLGEIREELDQVIRRSKGRMKRYLQHREQPFTPNYQGKWIVFADAKRIRQFTGMPQAEHKKRKIAALECFEEIPCNLCQTVCPEKAIDIGKVPRKTPVLDETRCTSCGLCLDACPSGSISMIQECEDRSLSYLTLPWKGLRPWKTGEFAILANRRGENLGSARVTNVTQSGVQWVELEVPTHLVWEARALKRNRSAVSPAALSALEDERYLESVSRQAQEAEEKKIEITIDGEKRLVRDQIPVTVALFEIGRGRAEDVLFCRDGSCGLCHVMVDGVKKLACQTPTHKGMALRLNVPASISTLGSNAIAPQSAPGASAGENHLCPCQKVKASEVIERMSQGKLQSPEAVVSVTHVGEGKCHGQLCRNGFREVLLDQGLDAAEWIDWRFPWSEWVLTNG